MLSAMLLPASSALMPDGYVIDHHYCGLLVECRSLAKFLLFLPVTVSISYCLYCHVSTGSHITFLWLGFWKSVRFLGIVVGGFISVNLTL